MDNKQILDFDKICQWFKEGEKKRENWLIGTEHEKFLFKKNEFKRLSYEDFNGIKFILNKIAEEEDWEKISENNEFCYKSHCVKTIMKVAEIIDPDKPFKVCYQSTFGPEQWIQPNIVDVLEDLAEKGIKKVSVACPSFTADCLETLEEIAVENHEDFEKNGGEYVKLIPSLNDNDDWVRNFAEYLAEKEEEFVTKLRIHGQ